MAKKTNNTQLRLLVLLVLLFVAVGLAVILTANNYISPTNTYKTKKLPGASSSPVNTANQASYNPKTNSEQAQRQAVSPTPSPTASQNRGTLKPLITGVDGDSNSSATQISVDALSDGATSGTCILTITQGSIKVSVTSSIVQIATYYGCATLKANKSQLSAGAASLVVSVSTSNNSGTSEVRNITVVK